MDPKEWLNSHEAKDRIRKFTYTAYSARRSEDHCYGGARGFIINHEQRLAILVSDFTYADRLYLKSGDIVHYKAVSGQHDLLIDASATQRSKNPPLIPFDDDRTPDYLDRIV